MPTNRLSRTCRVLVLGAVLLAIGAPASAEKQRQASGPRVDRAVATALRSGRDLRVIVRYKDAAAGKRITRQTSGRLRVEREHPSLRAVSLRVNHRALRGLVENRSGDVLSVSYDAPVQGNLLETLTEPTAVSVDASASTVARSRYGVSGAGVTVAVIDSGVKPHTDLPGSRIKVFVDLVNGRKNPYDDYGHGTHVAGIVAGSGAASSGKYTGVAPAASIVALKVLDANGKGRTSTVLAALEWVLANHAAYGIRVVNLSLGHPIYEPAATDPLVQLVEQLTKRGLLVVVSAGNMGRNALDQTVYGSITAPANAQGAITVGASDTGKTLARGDDSIAAFSSRGPTRYDYYVKPDVIAPGYQIASLVAPDSTLAVTYPNLRIGSSYFRLNGTSQAAPVVAGTAALLFQANPTLTSHTAKAILQFTAQRMRNADVMSQGAGQVNVAGAVRFAKMVYTSQAYGKRWVRGSRKPVQADLLFDEVAYWGKAIVWGTEIKTGTNALYVHLAQWDDNIVWGMFFDNIVWSMDDNIVWSMLANDNIVWSMDDNIVWGLTDDNIVWGFDDNIVWSMADNIVWSMGDNIVWSMADNIVWSMDTLVWGASDAVMAFSEPLDQEGGR